MFHAFDADELPPGMIRGKSFFEEIRRDILKKKKKLPHDQSWQWKIILKTTRVKDEQEPPTSLRSETSADRSKRVR